MKLEYKQALFEVYVILENTDEEIKNKIPKKFIEFIKDNMDINHKFKLEPEKELIEQKMMIQTKEILALIYRDYICTKKERKELLLQKKEKKIKKNKKNIKKKNIDYEKIKNNNKQRDIKEKLYNINENALIEVSQEKWYKKLISRILKIFGIKNN